MLQTEKAQCIATMCLIFIQPNHHKIYGLLLRSFRFVFIRAATAVITSCTVSVVI